MPKMPLQRDEIIREYYSSIQPVGIPAPALPEGLLQSAEQLTFGVSFNKDADPISHEANMASDVPVGLKMTPMLHQESTAQAILDRLQRGVSTVVLGDPVGAGKTLQALLVFLKLQKVNPQIMLVVTVPDVVIADWMDALQSIGISKSACQTIMTPKDISTLDINKLQQVLFVKQSLTLNSSNEIHQLYLDKLRAIYKRSGVFIFDEQTTQSSTTSILYDCAKHSPRLTLSGTIVTNSIQDISEPFREIRSTLDPMMANNSRFFTQYFNSTFFGKSAATPGEIFLNFLNISRLLHDSFYSRMPASLPIHLPEFQEKIVCIDQKSEAADYVARDEPAILLSGTGVSVKGDSITNMMFNHSHDASFYKEKLLLFIQECSTPRSAEEIVDILVVTASQHTSDALMKDLASSEQIHAANYVCIHIGDRRRDDTIAAARAAGKLIIFVTESSRVEGFNIQRHLGKIICFDAIRDAGDYAQALGRAVRRGNLTKKVQITQYCTSGIADYVQMRTSMTRKGKVMLELMHADPAVIFLLLVQDVLTRQQDNLREGINLEFILTSMHKVLARLCKNLQVISETTNPPQAVMDLIGFLASEHPASFELAQWRTLCATDHSLLQTPMIHLFLFEEGDDLLKFAFDGVSAQQFANIRDAMGRCKTHFINALAMFDLATLLQPQYLKLAYQFNVVTDYLLAIQKCLDVTKGIADAELLTLVKMVYSLPLGGSERATVQAILLQQLNISGFFKRTSCISTDDDSFLLYAFLDAALDERESCTLLMASLTPLLNTNPQQVYRVLCQISAYSSAHSKSLVKLILPMLYAELERLFESDPHRMSQIEYNDALAEHCDKLMPWIGHLLSFAKTIIASEEGESKRLDLMSRCSKLLSKCTKTERAGILKDYPELKKEPKQRSVATKRVVEEEQQLKLSNTVVPVEHHEEKKARPSAPTPLQRHSLFRQPSINSVSRGAAATPTEAIFDASAPTTIQQPIAFSFSAYGFLGSASVPLSEAGLSDLDTLLGEVATDGVFTGPEFDKLLASLKDSVSSMEGVEPSFHNL